MPNSDLTAHRPSLVMRALRLLPVLPTVATLFTTAAMYGALTVPAAAAHVCYPQFITSDFKMAVKASQAREKARADWTKKARAATGTNRLSWKGATDHEWSCTKPALRWKCTVRARPCVA
jgi:hypothetical protein